MAKFAPVVGIGMQRLLRKLGVMGDYHLLLAHEVLEHKQEYRNMYTHENGVFNPTNNFTIMDNSLVELGTPLDAGGLILAAYATHSALIVLPDALGDPGATVIRSEQAAVNLGARSERCSLMAVVQGRSFQDMLKCADYLARIPGVAMLSVPRITVKFLGSRYDVTQALFDRFRLPIHLLGFSNNLSDDIRTARLGCVSGIDSAMPVWLAVKGERLPEEPIEIDFGSRPEGYLNMDGDLLIPDRQAYIIENVNRVREWLSQARGVFDA